MDQSTRDKIRKLTWLLGHNTVPVFSELANGTRPPLPVGTALLVKEGRSIFLVTAAHVLDNLKYSQKKLLIYVGPSTTYKLSGDYIVSPLPDSQNRDDDTIDLGLMKLPNNFKENLSNRLCFPAENIIPDMEDKEGRTYLALGFPASKTASERHRNSIISEVVSYYAQSIDDERYDSLSFNRESHTLIKFDFKRSINDRGLTGKATSPSGLSGGPVFLLSANDHSRNNTRNVVIGIIIEHLKREKCLVATSGKYVREMLDHFDDIPKESAS